MVAIVAASAGLMAARNVADIQILLEQSAVNNRVVRTLQNLLSILREIVANVVPGANRVAMIELEILLEEIRELVVVNLPKKGQLYTTRYKKLKALLYTRRVSIQLQGVLTRLQAVLLTIQISSSLLAEKRDQFVESITQRAIRDAIVAEDKALISGIQVELAEAVKGLDTANVGHLRKSKIISLLEKTQQDIAQIDVGDDISLEDVMKASVFLCEVDDAGIPYQELEQKELIGEGGFGKVYKGTYNGNEVAIKVVPNNQDVLSADAFAKSQMELEIWKGINHENIVKLFGTSYDCARDEFWFVMELCDRSLHDILHKDTSFSYDLEYVIHVMHGIAKGLEYLHSIHVIHLDIKPRNVLLCSDTVDSPKPLVKLCDFGTSIQRDANVTRTLASGELSGSPAYLAPECCRIPARASFKSDIYSFGIVLWEIVHRKAPFQKQPFAAIVASIVQGVRPTINESVKPKQGLQCPDWVFSLIESCWHEDRAMRPDAHDIAQALESRDWSGVPQQQDENVTIDVVKADLNRAVANLEVFRGDENGPTELAIEDVSETGPRTKQIEDSESSGESKIRKKTWWERHYHSFVLALILVVIVAIAIGLGVTLGKNDDGSSSDPPIEEPNDENSCTYAPGFNGSFYCWVPNAQWTCRTGLGCSLVVSDYETYPLLKSDLTPGPPSTACEPRLRQLVEGLGMSMSDALTNILQGSRVLCPLPVNLMAISVDGNEEGSRLYLEHDATRNSVVATKHSNESDVPLRSMFVSQRSQENRFLGTLRSFVDGGYLNGAGQISSVGNTLTGLRLERRLRGRELQKLGSDVLFRIVDVASGLNTLQSAASDAYLCISGESQGISLSQDPCPLRFDRLSMFDQESGIDFSTFAPTPLPTISPTRSPTFSPGSMVPKFQFSSDGPFDIITSQDPGFPGCIRDISKGQCEEMCLTSANCSSAIYFANRFGPDASLCCLSSRGAENVKVPRTVAPRLLLRNSPNREVVGLRPRGFSDAGGGCLPSSSFENCTSSCTANSRCVSAYYRPHVNICCQYTTGLQNAQVSTDDIVTLVKSETYMQVIESRYHIPDRIVPMSCLNQTGRDQCSARCLENENCTVASHQNLSQCCLYSGTYESLWSPVSSGNPISPVLFVKTNDLYLPVQGVEIIEENDILPSGDSRYSLRCANGQTLESCAMLCSSFPDCNSADYDLESNGGRCCPSSRVLSFATILPERRYSVNQNLLLRVRAQRLA